jgi:hypothetical protein
MDAIISSLGLAQNPLVSAIFCVAAISWIFSFAICLLSLSFVSKGAFSHWMPEIKSISLLVSGSLCLVQLFTHRWWLF